MSITITDEADCRTCEGAEGAHYLKTPPLPHRLFLVITEIRGAILSAQSGPRPIPCGQDFLALADAAREELLEVLEGGVGLDHNRPHTVTRLDALPITASVVRTVAASQAWLCHSDSSRRVRALADLPYLDLINRGEEKP